MNITFFFFFRIFYKLYYFLFNLLLFIIYTIVYCLLYFFINVWTFIFLTFLCLHFLLFFRKHSEEHTFIFYVLLFFLLKIHLFRRIILLYCLISASFFSHYLHTILLSFILVRFFYLFREIWKVYVYIACAFPFFLSCSHKP